MNTFHFAFKVFIFLLALFYLNSCQEKLEESIVPIAETDTAGVFAIEEAFPEQTGILKEGTLFGQPITYKEINGKAVFQGDIILRPEQLNPVGDSMSTDNGRTSGAGSSNKLLRWRSFTIPYTIDPALPNQSRVTNAIAHWEAKTPLRFVVRTNQTDYITFQPGAGCDSEFGRVGGQQFINLAPACNTGSVIHEIGHAVGLLHEQTRSNRNNHIIVKYDNIQKDKWDQFNKYKDEGIDGFDFGSFDFSSIMLYPPLNSFAIDQSKPTMTRKDGTTWTAQRDKLSPTDIRTVVSMYSNLYIIWQGSLYSVNLSTGQPSFIASDWDGFNAKTMAEDDEYLWAINGETLWRVNRLNGSYKSFGSGWGGAIGVTGIVNGDTRWAIQGSTLYAINKNGVRAKAGNFNWSGSKAIFAHKDYLFIVDGSGTLWKLDMNTSKWHNLGGGWGGTKAIAVAYTTSNEVFIIADALIWRVNIHTGNWSKFGSNTWHGTEGMVGINGKLYIVDNDTLWEVDENGNRRSLGGGWSGTQSMGIVRNGHIL